MKKLFCLFCFLLAFKGYGQILATDQLKEDFDKLRFALEEAHGGLYRYYSKSEIDLLFDQSRKKIKHPMSQWEFYGLLSEVLGSIGDGHMKLEYGEGTPKPFFFPFRILTEKGKAVILSNDTKSDSVIKPGMQLLSINGHSFETIAKKVLPKLISGDGYNQTGRIASLSRNFAQYYWLFVDTSSVFVTKVKDSSGKVLTERIHGVTNLERDANRNQNPVNEKMIALTKPLEGANDNVLLRIINDTTGYLRIRYLIGDRFDKEIDSVLSVVIKQDIKTLLLDIRGNGGGLDEWGAFLVSRFTTKPFRYLDRIHTRVLIPSFASWKQKPPVDLIQGTEASPDGGYLIKSILNRTIEEQRPAERPYRGKLIVLIDGKTFSAASDFSAVLNNVTDAVFVGVETGGGSQGNTSALNAMLKLPHSKFTVNIHLWDIWSAVKPPKLKGRGVMPDYHIERKSHEWLSGIDTQLAFALKLAGRNE